MGNQLKQDQQLSLLITWLTLISTENVKVNFADFIRLSELIK